MKFSDAHIRTFIKIAQTCSISGAADALELSQSGLSKQLRQLEQHVGQQLFRRNGRGVALTATGQKLYDVATKAYASIDGTVDQLKTAEGVTEGTLRIATMHTLSTYFIPTLLASLLAQRPKLNISLLCRSSPEVVEMVASGKADIGFVYDVAVTTGNVATQRLFTEKMVLIHQPGAIDKGVPLDLSGVNLPLVCFPRPYALRSMLQRQDITFSVVAEVETADAMLNLVHDGLGCCVLPEGMKADLIEGRGLERTAIAAPTLDRLVVAATLAGRAHTPLVDLLLGLAAESPVK